MQSMADKYSAFRFEGHEIVFWIENDADLIQRQQRQGKFYEAEELQIIRNYAGSSRIFYDIGSNVGNHLVYMGKILGAELIVPFEANPAAVKTLRKNIAGNGLEGMVDARHLGLGVGARDEVRQVFSHHANNLGAARLKRYRPDQVEEDGFFEKVQVRALDSFDLPRGPDFVKIDVEGMEMDVLDGMSACIARSRPAMFIEVGTHNIERFLAWVEQNDYRTVETFTRYQSSVNYMIVAH
jgi:FkbM family methyltransferase